MNPERGAGERNPHQQTLLRKILVFPLGMIYRLWTLTIRMHYSDQKDLKEMQNWNGPGLLFGTTVFFSPGSGFCVFARSAVVTG